MISLIIPAYNEETYIEYVLKNISELERFDNCELIVVDGGSSDKTKEISKKYAKVLMAPKGKAVQQNIGAKAAHGNILFFVHADMTLPKTVLRTICETIDVNGFDGGGFVNEFTEYNKKIKMLGRILNLRIRNIEQSDRNIFYGDNGIFVRKKVFEELGGFKEIPIMEDYEFSVRMKKKYKVTKVNEPKIFVDPRRHIKSGFIKTRLQWIIIRKLYKLGISARLLTKLYRDVR